MPKIPIDYDNTQIYKLVHKDDLENENVYVGHTTNWTQRKKEHKSSISSLNPRKNSIKLYQFIRDHGGWDKLIMVWLEDFPCGGKHEACARERYWYEHYNCKLNSQVPNRTRKEYV